MRCWSSTATAAGSVFVTRCWRTRSTPRSFRASWRRRIPDWPKPSEPVETPPQRSWPRTGRRPVVTRKRCPRRWPQPGRRRRCSVSLKRYSHLERAIALWHRVPDSRERPDTDLSSVCAWAAELASLVGAAPRAVELARMAIELIPADEPHRAGLVRVRLGQYLHEAGHTDAALRALTKAVDVVPAEPPSPELASCLASLAGGLTTAWRHARVPESGDRGTNARSAGRCRPGHRPRPHGSRLRPDVPGRQRPGSARAAPRWWTLQQMAGMDRGPWTALGAFGWFVSVWVVMMAAMMFPSVAPTVALYARMSRTRLGPDGVRRRLPGRLDRRWSGRFPGRGARRSRRHRDLPWDQAGPGPDRSDPAGSGGPTS